MWTVNADVILPTELLETEQYAARTLRPRLHRKLDPFLLTLSEPTARVPWKSTEVVAGATPPTEMLAGLPLDRRVGPVAVFKGGTAGRSRLPVVRAAIRRQPVDLTSMGWVLARPDVRDVPRIVRPKGVLR